MRKLSSYAAGLYFVLIVGSLITIVIKSLITKRFGVEAFGMYQYFLSLNTIATLFLSFGLPDLLTKTTSEKREFSRDFNRFALALTFLISIVCVVAAILLWNVVTDRVYLMSLLIIGPSVMLPLATAIFRGDLSTKAEVVYRLFRRIAPLLFLLTALLLAVPPTIQLPSIAATVAMSPWVQSLFPSNGLSPLTPVFTTVLGWAVGSLVLFYLIHRRDLFMGPRDFFRVLRAPWLKRQLMLSSSLWGAAIVFAIGDQADALVIGNFIGYYQLGEYAGALLYYGFLGQVLEVWGRLYVTLLPRDDNRSFYKYRRVISLTSVMLPLLGFYAFSLIPLTQSILLDDSLTMIVPLYGILSFTYTFRAIELVNNSLAITVERPDVNAKSTAFGLAVYLPVMVLMISTIGVYGAAIGQVLFWALYSITQAFLLRKEHREHVNYSTRVALTTFVIYAIMMGLYLVINNFIIGLVVCTAFYLTAGHLMKLWDLPYVWRVGTKIAADVLQRFTKRSNVQMSKTAEVKP
jgi:O-antigen/teichoic acid export membrane protein